MPFLVRVLNGLGDLDEQLQPIVRRKIVLVAVLGDPGATHQLHDKVRPARVRRASFQDFGNVRMIHSRATIALCSPRPKTDSPSPPSPLEARASNVSD